MAEPSSNKSKRDDAAKGAFFIYGAVAAGSAAVAGWIYSYISPSRATVVIESAQGFLDLLFVAWYMVMGTVSILLRPPGFS